MRHGARHAPRLVLHPRGINISLTPPVGLGREPGPQVRKQTSKIICILFTGISIREHPTSYANVYYVKYRKTERAGEHRKLHGRAHARRGWACHHFDSS